jgi:Secretion system C-terminal sorting domain
MTNTNSTFFRKLLFVFATSNLFFQILNAQSIQVIPKPAAGFEFGGEIPYNNTFLTGFFVRKDTTLNGHLATWNGSNLTVIPNPTNDLSTSGVFGVTGIGVVDTDKNIVYGEYINSASKFQLGFYNGNKWTLVDNPDDGLGCVSHYGYLGHFFGQILKIPIIYKGKLYLPYIAADNITKMAVFDGVSLQIVTTPNSLVTYEGKPIIYNNKLYSAWITKDSVSHLVEYDGTSFKIISNPANIPYTGIVDESVSRNNIGYSFYSDPVVYQGKLYYAYYSGGITVQLSQFDSITNVLSLIDNPDNNSVGVFRNNFFEYNNKIYLEYTDASLNYKLAEFDGSKLSIVPSAENSVYPSGTFFTRYNGKLYFVNNPAGNSLQFYNYDSATATINTVPNFDATGNVQLTLPIVYNNKLWFGYQQGGSFNVNLAQYNGQQTTIVSNPDEGSGYLNYYLSLNYPFTYNNTLFFPYETDTAGITGTGANLAYYHDAVLAVSLNEFLAQLKDKDVILQWQTASETNTSYFNIQRSNDGVHFNIISKVTAAGNSASTKNYTYTDVNIMALHAGKLYYRLQKVDNDGSSIYSNIKTVDLSNGHSLFSVSPNPSKDFINITSSYTVSAAQINITDMNGKTLFTGRQNFVAGQQLKVSLSKFPSEVLIVIIKSTISNEQFKIIKQ